MSNDSTMTKCRSCGQSAHTSTTCNNGTVGSFNLFGVRIDPKADDQTQDDHPEPEEQLANQEQRLDNQDQQDVNGIRKCKSMKLLNLFNTDHHERGYLSDEHVDHRKKGMPWTEAEHISFLMGLEKLGKGDWRGISKKYVPSRTPTQIASHAQKYFIRLNATQEKPKRRSSLFDISFNDSSTAMALDTTSLRLPVPRMGRTYGVRDYFYMHPGYENNNDHKSKNTKCLPVVSFQNQNQNQGPNLLNGGWAPHLATQPLFVSRPDPQPLFITHGEEKITEKTKVED